MIFEHNDTLWLSKGPETYSYMSATDESGKKIGYVSWNDTQVSCSRPPILSLPSMHFLMPFSLLLSSLLFQALQSLAQPATANTEDHPSGGGSGASLPIKAHVMYMGGRKGKPNVSALAPFHSCADTRDLLPFLIIRYRDLC